jgi:hypothetical protein
MKKFTVKEYCTYLQIIDSSIYVNDLPDYILNSSLLSNDELNKKEIKKIRKIIERKPNVKK